jgi:hypothetical protein
MTYYIVTKHGVFPHGVFYITTDKEDAIKHCDTYAANDVDDHHIWAVEEYAELDVKRANSDGIHVCVYRTKHSQCCLL